MAAVPDWTTACPDWEKRILAGDGLVPFSPLFPDQAEMALRVFRELVLVDVAGCPRMGDVTRDWLMDFVSAIFGAYDVETGRRLITEFFLLISKKNAKSTTAAGIMLTALILNWRQSGEYLILAPTIEVANNSFFPARDMIRADEELDALLHVQEHYRQITHRVTGATLKIVAADNEAAAGKKAIGVLIDELWLFGKRAGAENLLREATGGLASRPEGFTIYLSTQSDEPPAGVFAQKLNYARGVRDGRIQDKRFLPVIYEFPAVMIEAEEHLKPENFRVTNPNLGASVDEEFLVRQLAQSQEGGEESVRGFLAKHLNVEIGLGLHSDRWTGALFWESQGNPLLDLDELLERSEVVVVGGDGGGLDDMLGLAAIGREKETGRWLHWAHAWIHPVALERRKRLVPKYRDLEKAGELTIVDEMGQDMEQVTDYLKRIEASRLLDRVGLDPAGVGDLMDAVAAAGIAEDRVVGISQGWKLTASIKTLERRLAEGEFEHGATGLMAWCVGNAKVEPRGNAVLITKAKSGSAKIDPLMATLNCTALMAMNPKPRNQRLQLFTVG